MTDTPEPVAVIGKDWSLRWASVEPLADIVKRTGISIGLPLYAAPIGLYESQVRWRKAFDDMHQRAMNAEAALATRPADDLVRQLVEALTEQTGECFDEACGMCARHERILDAASAAGYGSQS